MEASLCLDGSGFGRQIDATFCDDILKVIDGRDVFVDKRFVDQCPQRFGGLQFGRVGRKKHETQALGNVQSRLAVPAGVVEHENDDASG